MAKSRLPTTKSPCHKESAPGKLSDFARILEWTCFRAAQIGNCAACIKKHRQALISAGETEARLREAADWRSSSAFTAKEKAALSLGEAISVGHSEESTQYNLEQARHYFDAEELVRLTMAVTAVNDWISLHSDSEMRVLVVEDNPLDQELLRGQLQKAEMGNNVAFIPDGPTALELLSGPDSRQFRRNLIAVFLDLHLPGMSGLELLRRIRAMPDMGEFPVIVMTSSNNPRDIEECKKLKAAFVPKPVTYCAFCNAVAAISLVDIA